MNPEIQHLLKLTDEFPTRKRIEFDNPDDCQFIIAVFKALKEAAPAIRQLAAQPPSEKTVGDMSLASSVRRAKAKSARAKQSVIVVPPA